MFPVEKNQSPYGSPDFQMKIEYTHRAAEVVAEVRSAGSGFR